MENEKGGSLQKGLSEQSPITQKKPAKHNEKNQLPKTYSESVRLNNGKAGKIQVP